MFLSRGDRETVNEQEMKNKIRRLQSELKNCRNEFCLKCGKYHLSYAGACDLCRYRRGGEWEADLDE